MRLIDIQAQTLARARTAPELDWFDLATGVPAADRTSYGPTISSALRVDGTLAPMTYEAARDLAWAFGARLPTRLEATALGRLGTFVPYQTLAWNDPDFATVAGAERVSRRVDQEIARAEAPLGALVPNESKMWLRGATPGWSLLCGFFDVAGVPVQSGKGAVGKPGYGPLGEPHNAHHVDYSMAPRFVLAPFADRPADLVALAEAQPAAPGPAWLKEYFRRATRRPELGGGRSGYAKGWDWCAAGACFLASETGLGLGIHGYRITVWELIADARESGRWHDVATGYEPKPGDLACFARKGDPRRSGEAGHVETVIDAPSSGCYGTWSGNSPGWRRKARMTTDPAVVGYVER